MDVLNFISWLKSKKQVTTVDASQTLIPVGLKDARRKDGYLPGAISVEDFIALSPGLPSFIGYNETTSTLWNNGFNNVQSNLSFGEGALESITTGFTNTAVGFRSSRLLTSGTHNTSIGNQSLNSATTASHNTAIGSLSLNYLTTGIQNTSIGYASGWFLTTGSYNTSIGYQALRSSVTSSNNTAIGYNAATTNILGANNTAIGVSTSTGDFSGSVIIGKDATATASNQFVIGSSTTNAGAVTTETITANRTWTVRINGANYKIPMVAI